MISSGKQHGPPVQVMQQAEGQLSRAPLLLRRQASAGVVLLHCGRQGCKHSLFWRQVGLRRLHLLCLLLLLLRHRLPTLLMLLLLLGGRGILPRFLRLLLRLLLLLSSSSRCRPKLGWRRDGGGGVRPARHCGRILPRCCLSRRGTSVGVTSGRGCRSGILAAGRCGTGAVAGGWLLPQVQDPLHL
jgi:hypothetical protein